MNFGGGLPTGGAGASQNPEELQQQAIIKIMKAGMESCATKTAIGGVGGFAIGGLFGLFMASMSYDTPMSGPGGAQALADLPLRQQLRQGFKDMGKRSWSSAKNFGMVGGIYSGVECGIESYRAKTDIYNHISAGCITGGALGMSAGPQGAAIGCAGFAAFSAAIEMYMNMD